MSIQGCQHMEIAKNSARFARRAKRKLLLIKSVWGDKFEEMYEILPDKDETLNLSHCYKKDKGNE